MYKNDEMVASLLKVDALDEAEQITGQSYKKDKRTESLGFMLHHILCQTREKVLSNSNDSYYGMDFQPYVEIVQDIGFVKIHEHPFTRKNDNVEEIFQIWFHPEGVLLSCDSYIKTSLNGSTIFYNWKPNHVRGSFDFTSSGHYWTSETIGVDHPEWEKHAIWIGHHDTREAIRLKIRRLKENGKFLWPWVCQPFLWFVDGSQDSDKYLEINRNLIAKFPKKVKDGMNYPTTKDGWVSCFAD